LQNSWPEQRFCWFKAGKPNRFHRGKKSANGEERHMTLEGKKTRKDGWLGGWEVIRTQPGVKLGRWELTHGDNGKKKSKNWEKGWLKLGVVPLERNPPRVWRG